jgi:hypothetical protein
VRSITFDPHNPSTIYVGVEEGGLFCSRDRGHTFEPLNQNIYADIHCVAADPNDLARVYATTGHGLYVSTNRGASWSLIKPMARAYTVPLLLRRNAHGVVYTAGASGPPPTWAIDDRGADALMYRSDETGTAFAPIAASDGIAHPMRGMVMRLIARPDDHRVIYGALSDGGIIRIDERADTVSMIAEKLPPAYDIAILP